MAHARLDDTSACSRRAILLRGAVLPASVRVTLALSDRSVRPRVVRGVRIKVRGRVRAQVCRCVAVAVAVEAQGKAPLLPTGHSGVKTVEDCGGSPPTMRLVTLIAAVAAAVHGEDERRVLVSGATGRRFHLYRLLKADSSIPRCALWSLATRQRKSRMRQV